MNKMIPVAIIAGIALVWPAFAASQDRPRTPQKWDYEIVDGKRVPKAKRTVNPDGSWREEKRDGKCTEIKEMSASGELKISRKCDDEG